VKSHVNTADERWLALKHRVQLASATIAAPRAPGANANAVLALPNPASSYSPATAATALPLQALELQAAGSRSRTCLGGPGEVPPEPAADEPADAAANHHTRRPGLNASAGEKVAIT